MIPECCKFPSEKPWLFKVTYGGAVRRAFREVSRVGAVQVAKLAGDWRPSAMRSGFGSAVNVTHGIYVYKFAI